MLKKALLALFIVAAAGCSSNEGPSETQVKQALDDYYATASGGADLKKALGSEVGVKACRADGPGYRCAILNKDLGSTIDMLFVYDKSSQKWKFQKEGA